MSIKNISLHFILIISLIFSPLAHASGVSVNVDNYVTRYKNSAYAYTLSAEDFEKALDENGLRGPYAAQLQLASDKEQGARDSLGKIEELRNIENMDLEAFQIVDQMFNQSSIEQMNLDLLSIMHDYLFDADSRGPLSHIIKAIENYNFSPEQITEMKKQATYYKQYATGSMWAFALVTVGTILSLRTRGAWVVENISRRFGQGKNTAAKAASKPSAAVKTTTPSPADKEIEDFIRRTNKLRGASPLSEHMLKDAQLIKQSSSVLKTKFFSNISAVSKKQSFKNFAFITGASITGGVANIGYNALNRAFFNEDITNSYFNPVDIQTDIYDGLAVLNLSCQSHDLLERAKSIPTHAEEFEPTVEQIELLKELNSLYSEFTILKKLTPQYLEKILLDESISANTIDGTVTLDLMYKEYRIQETIACEKLKNTGSEINARVEASLSESLLLLTEAFLILSGQN
ncbi:MAG: hypothetical protein KDD38_05955 [Bdellovibrionales bacterium]|nr:hypothetical protein [Bdellovibrionales bacterium]